MLVVERSCPVSRRGVVGTDTRAHPRARSPRLEDVDFYSAYAHGFARVAACTLPVTVADPAANARTVIAQAARPATRTASRWRCSPSCA